MENPFRSPSVSSGDLWDTMKAVAPKLLTLIIPVHQDDGRLLLGKKLRGFGAGFWNGFGGKVEVGESIEEGARRELEEEAGIRALHLHRCGLLNFMFDDRPEPWEVHVYRCERWEGTPGPSDEMLPRWFAPEEVPFQSMWADDQHWYPLFLERSSFVGSFWFTQTTTLVRHKLEATAELPPLLIR